jgi:hypothetical protein
MDWNVKVVTQSNQIKDVKVFDYIYPSDAVDAAVAQTDAKSVITCNPITNDIEYNSNSNNYYISDSSSGIDWDNNQFFQYFVVTLIPSVILWLVSPVICCIFNSVLCYYWFKK